MQVNYSKLDKELPDPRQAHSGDAGIDLYAREGVELKPGDRAVVPTGLTVAIPEGYAGLVIPRSGHAAKGGIGIVNAPGVIDSGYRGEVAVILVNHGSEPVWFERGDRIAQLVVVPVPAVEWTETAELPPTERGADGFGSTGP